MHRLWEIAVSLWFSNSLVIVHFSDNVLDVFQRSRQLKPWAKEAGGQLFCLFEEGKVLIEGATRPGHGDKRSRYSFWPNRSKEQKDINGQFEQGLHYIGDWHTHPERIPNPSGEDIRKMQAVYRESIHCLKYMILVIVGQEKLPTGLWVGYVSHNSVVGEALLINAEDRIIP
jgi:integrative and conjugative element protein (TIGR02256 family)